MLSRLSRSTNEKLVKAIESVSAELYCSEDSIESSLRLLLGQISNSCEDIRILAVKYILELLELKELSTVREVLCRVEMLKRVYQCMLNLKQDMSSEQSTELGVLCAKVVGLLGLCHSFVNDPVLLKANN